MAIGLQAGGQPGAWSVAAEHDQVVPCIGQGLLALALGLRELDPNSVPVNFLIPEVPARR